MIIGNALYRREKALDRSYDFDRAFLELAIEYTKRNEGKKSVTYNLRDGISIVVTGNEVTREYVRFFLLANSSPNTEKQVITRVKELGRDLIDKIREIESEN